MYLKTISRYWIQIVLGEMKDKEVAFQTMKLLPVIFSENCRIEDLERFEKMLFLDEHTKKCVGCLWKLYNSLAEICIFNKELYSYHRLYLKKTSKIVGYEKGWRYGWAMSRLAVSYTLISENEKAEEVILKSLSRAPELLTERIFPFPENTIPKMVKSMIPAVIVMGLINILYNKDIKENEKLLENLKSYFTEREVDRYWYIDALTLDKCSSLSKEKLQEMIMMLLKVYKFTDFDNIKKFFIDELDWIRDNPANIENIKPKPLKKKYVSKKYFYKYNGD